VKSQTLEENDPMATLVTSTPIPSLQQQSSHELERSISRSFGPISHSFFWRRYRLKERLDDNDPHVKVVELFLPKTMVVFVSVSEAAFDEETRY